MKTRSICTSLACFFLIFIFVLYGCVTTRNYVKTDIVTVDEIEYDHYVLGSIQIFVEQDYLDAEEENQVISKILNSVSMVTRYLRLDKTNVDQIKPVYYVKSGAFISYCTKKTVYLSHVREQSSPIIHETVHILSGYQTDRIWLSEGVAIHLHQKLGGETAFPNYGKDLHDEATRLAAFPALGEITTFQREYASVRPGNEGIRKAFYIFSGSLIRYIEENYGREAILSLNKGESVEAVLAKDFESVVRDWKEFIGFE